MVTVIARPGPLRTALLDGFSARAQAVHLYDAANDDLFLLAMKSTAIVYAERDDAPPEAFEEALRAADAPGSRRFVLVSSAGRLDDRMKTLRKRGVPYVVLKTPPLLEDALDALISDGSARIWVPGDFKLVAASAATIVDAIVDALGSDSDGATVEVAGQTLGAAEVAARLRLRPSVQASTLPTLLYRIGERLGAIARPNPNRPFLDQSVA